MIKWKPFEKGEYCKHCKKKGVWLLDNLICNCDELEEENTEDFNTEDFISEKDDDCQSDYGIFWDYGNFFDKDLD